MSFSLSIALSTVLATTYVVVIGLVAERKSTSIGGLIAGMPSLVLISVVFISLTQGHSAASHAAYGSLIALGGAAIFSVCFARLTSRGGLAALIIALIPWFLVATIGVFTRTHIAFLAFAYIPCFLMSLYISKILPHSNHRVALQRPIRLLLLQGLMSGALVATAIYTAKHLTPSVGGIIAGFPVIISSSSYFFWIHHHDVEASANFGRGIFRGNFTTALFSVMFGALILVFKNTAAATVVAYVAAVAAAIAWNHFANIARNKLTIET